MRRRGFTVPRNALYSLRALGESIGAKLPIRPPQFWMRRGPLNQRFGNRRRYALLISAEIPPTCGKPIFRLRANGVRVWYLPNDHRHISTG